MPQDDPNATDTPSLAAELDPTRKASITQADGAPPPADVRQEVRKGTRGGRGMAVVRQTS